MRDEAGRITRQFELLHLHTRNENWLCIAVFAAAVSASPLFILLPIFFYRFRSVLMRNSDAPDKIPAFSTLADAPPHTYFISSEKLRTLVPSKLVPRWDFATLSFGNRTFIVYQKEATNLDRQELRAILNHEFGHAGRLDIWFILVGAMLSIYFVWYPIGNILFHQEFFERNIPLFPLTHAVIAAIVLISASSILRKREYLADRFAWERDPVSMRRFLSRRSDLEKISRAKNWLAKWAKILWHPTFAMRLNAQETGLRTSPTGTFFQATFWAFSMGFLALFLTLPRSIFGTPPAAFFAPLAVIVLLFAFSYSGASVYRIRQIAGGGAWILAALGYATGFAAAMTWLTVGEEIFVEGNVYTYWNFTAWAIAFANWFVIVTLSGFVVGFMRAGVITWAVSSCLFAIACTYSGFAYILIFGAQTTDALPAIFPLPPMKAAILATLFSFGLSFVAFVCVIAVRICALMLARIYSSPKTS